MRFEYDEEKNEYNLARHGVDFPTAALIFDDPYAMTIRDVLHDEDEERYNTVGEFSPGSILFVVHTLFANEKGEEQKRQAAVIAAKTDANIDLTDAREGVDWSGAEIGKFYRPPRKPVTMRLDIDIIKWLKSHGRGYQTRVNALLRHGMNSRWAARHEDEAIRQKAQAAYDGLHAKRASGSIKRIHADNSAQE
jgi:uncharacterized DUF497 family protein